MGDLRFCEGDGRVLRDPRALLGGARYLAVHRFARGDCRRGAPLRVHTAGAPQHRAILRSRLYDIEVLINRTLVYGLLTVTLVVIHVGSVVSLQATLRVRTGQEPTLAVVASTLAIAAVFDPMRRQVQAFVDRRFYRKKYDAARTLEGFSARL